MPKLRLVLGDQLSSSISSLSDLDYNDIILFCELEEEATYVKHHPKKIAFIFAAMRHFALELKNKGYKVRYVKLQEENNTGSFTGELQRAVCELNIKEVIVTEPGEYRIVKMMETWPQSLGITLEVRKDSRFLCSIEEFKRWAIDKKQLRMEYFYREMRKKYQILLNESSGPIGGKWNFDKENRKSPGKNLFSLPRISHPKSKILKDVLELVANRFSQHFGDLLPFNYAVTREQALLELDHFIEHILPDFGEYQDAMLKGEAYLNHSLLSSYINVGLLLPLEICQKVEKSYHEGKVPINSAEGFVRQIMGWREYIRGIYWLKMPEYGDLNYLNAKNPLPDFYWGAKTKMLCISEAVAHTQKHAYSHHIQRLMITGNFALLAGIDVNQVQKWYLSSYSDAYEWVEMPNTLGMALFADGGIVGSKPYAASGKYINKMSNFCQSCCYDSQDTLGENACPFNALYWNFLAQNRSKLESNMRLAYIYSTWDKFSAEKQNAILEKAKDFLKNKLCK